MPSVNTRTETARDGAGLADRLRTARGQQYWRCLEELAGGPAFEEFLRREYPDQEAEWSNPITRRQFLVLMGASLALAGFTGCTRPPAETIIPYIRQPERLTPGRPLFFATAMPLGGFSTGLLVRSNEGRPTKVEGNRDHPASLGATDVFAQASILGLYDPDRAQSVTRLGRIATWEDAVHALQGALDQQRGKKGAGLRILTEAVASPSLRTQLRDLLRAYPAARWHEYEPVGREAVREGTRLAYGTDLHVFYNFAEADVVLSLDADFLASGPGHLRYTREFTDRRRVRGDQLRMNRLYVVESTVTQTGAAADHRLPLRPRDVERFARAVAGRLSVAGLSPGERTFGGWNLDELAADLRDHRGRSLVVAGDGQPAVVHALAHGMNQALGNLGRTVVVTDPIEADLIEGGAEPAPGSLADLVQEMRVGTVEALLILGGNPVYTAPADAGFSDALFQISRKSGSLTAHLSLHDNETTRLCQWLLPETHYLEAWSDGRAYDGTAAIQQPLIAPLYGGRSAHEVVGILTNGLERPGHEIVKDYWRRYFERRVRSGDFEAFWRRALHDGVVAGTRLQPRTGMTLRTDWASRPPAPATEGFDVVFRPDPTIHDGRFANNGWLQELPKPLTKLTWDNAVLLSPATADRLGLHYEMGKDGGRPGWRGGERGEVIAPVVRVHFRGPPVDAPAWVTPGHPDETITLHLGYGRERAGHVGTGTGFNFYALRTADAPWSGGGATLERTGREYTLAGTQQHYLMENRNLMRAAPLEHYRSHRDFATAGEHVHEHPAEAEKTIPERQSDLQEQTKGSRLPLSLFPDYNYDPPQYRWGMAIDLTVCTGCSACVVACQAENNIPVVGKTEVTRGREMHWLRIDRYYEVDRRDPAALRNPRAYFQPVPCMQCENAPCELPCPVEATSHSHDGLNDMVYNRCVGTRYCSNNCPYKVRRFNFLQYADYATESLRLGYNPDVTVRSRGVMEKCTYCVQRIRRADIEVAKRALEPGTPDLRQPVRELQTACQQACPAHAIVFGDINDRTSEVRKMKDEPRNYGLLADLNTRPRTTYLAALRNPNPRLETA